MSRKIRAFIVVEGVLVALIAGIQMAYAAPERYIDPATGGMLFQVLAVVVTMASGIIFLFANKIKLFFNRGKQNSEILDDDADMLLMQLDDPTVEGIPAEEDEEDEEKKISPVVR